MIIRRIYPLEYTLLLQIDYERFQLVAVNDCMAGSVQEGVKLQFFSCRSFQDPPCAWPLK